MEIIHICPMNDQCRQRALERAQELHFGDKAGENRVHVWIQEKRDGDLVIMLHNDSAGENGAYSVEGLQIAEYFLRFGWVSHTIWCRV